MGSDARELQGEARDELRRRAEHHVHSSESQGPPPRNEELRDLVHELRVHQAELEMQNDELRRTQAELSEARDSLERLFNLAPVGYVALDGTGLIILANETFTEMVNSGAGRLRGRAFVELLVPPDRATFLGRYRSIFRSPAGKHLDVRLDTRGKKPIWCRLEGRRFDLSVLGAPTPTDEPHLLFSLTDVTSQKLAEEDLRRLNAISTEALAPTAGPEVFDRVCAEVCSATGFAGAVLVLTGEVEGRLMLAGHSGLSSPTKGESVSIAEPPWNHAAEGRGILVEHPVETQSPWFEEVKVRTRVCIPIRATERNVGLLVLVASEQRQISASERQWLESASGILGSFAEGRLAEEQLRQSEHRYRTLFESAGDAILILDEEFQVLDANEVACERLGHSRTELLELSLSDIDPDAGSEQGDELRERLRKGESVSLETRYLTRDGKKVPTEILATSFNYQGSPVILVIARDLTQRRELERQLQQSQRMEAVGRLAGGVAHDFNNLLTAILGFAELISEEATEEGVIEYGKEITRSAKRAASLTQQLLTFSRRQMLEAQPVEINRLVADMRKMLRRLIGEHIEIRTDLERKVGSVHGDPSQLEQVIVNLVVNARDAMQDGGILTIRTARLRLDRAFRRAHPEAHDGEYVLLSVADTGHGMDEETQSRAFEPFFTTKGTGRGTGLGLSTVYGIVRQCGGFVTLESAVGRGSRFSIYLPRMADEPAQEGESSPNAGTRRGSELILLVEDEEGVRRMTRKSLERLGYQVMEAANGPEAEKLLESRDGPPMDLLVTDVVMPGMKGTELARRLRVAQPDLRVLYISGYTEERIGDIEQERSAFLQKPFSPSSLAENIRTLLDD